MTRRALSRSQEGARPESEFPTLAMLHAGLARLVEAGLGELPVQVLIAPDSTVQAIARFTMADLGMDPDGKPAAMVVLEDTPERPGVGVMSVERTLGGGMNQRAQ